MIFALVLVVRLMSPADALCVGTAGVDDHQGTTGASGATSARLRAVNETR